MKSPVLLIIFKRPQTTKKVLESLSKVKPSRLYVAMNAPRDNVKGELEKCLETRKLINTINWQCNIQTLIRNNNLECGESIKTAIDWFFENEEEGIILEDDIVPDMDFYDYCDYMLEKYRNSDLIQQITGWNYLNKNKNINYKYSYYYSCITSSWGWCTWKKIWIDFDVSMKGIVWNNIKEKLIKKGFPSYSIRYYKYIFDRVKEEIYGLNTWDYQFLFNMIDKDRYSISPTYNMINNVGFGKDATHTTKNGFKIDNKYQPIFPLIEPNVIGHCSYLDIMRVKDENIKMTLFSYLIKNIRIYLHSLLNR